MDFTTVAWIGLAGAAAIGLRGLIRLKKTEQDDTVDLHIQFTEEILTRRFGDAALAAKAMNHFEEVAQQWAFAFIRIQPRIVLVDVVIPERPHANERGQLVYLCVLEFLRFTPEPSEPGPVKFGRVSVEIIADEYHDAVPEQLS